jgi:hypothetical protein
VLSDYAVLTSKLLQQTCERHLGILRPVRLAHMEGGRQLKSIPLSDTVKKQRRVFCTTLFRRWLRKTTLTETDLCNSVREMAAGLIDADLGGHVFKKRVAVQGRGKSGGARVLVATNLENRWFFVFGFEKNERANISDRELAGLQKLAAVLLKLDADRIATELELGNLTEICHEAKSHTH